MSELSTEAILSKVRENKELLARRTEELDAAQQELDRVRDEYTQVQADLAEKDQALQDLVVQNQALEAERDQCRERNQELQEQVLNLQGDLETAQAETLAKSRLAQELTDLLQ